MKNLKRSVTFTNYVNTFGGGGGVSKTLLLLTERKGDGQKSCVNFF